MAITKNLIAMDTLSTSTTTNTAPLMIRDDTDCKMINCKRPLNECIEEQPLTKKQRTKKTVTFGNEYIHEVDRISDIDARSVWMSDEEFYHGRRCDNHWINFHTCCDGSYRQELYQVLGAACGKMEALEGPVLALANSDCRGLEKDMTPCFRQRQKHVVRNVLQSQSAMVAALNANNEKANHQHKGAEILAAHYRKLALPSSRFARLLAQGDAIVASR